MRRKAVIRVQRDLYFDPRFDNNFPAKYANL